MWLRLSIILCVILEVFTARLSPSHAKVGLKSAVAVGATFLTIGLHDARASVPMTAFKEIKTPSAFLTAVERAVEEPFDREGHTNGQSPGWELARQKRTAAIKLMQEKKMLRVETDDKGNQYLSLPWIPDKRVKYKSLDINTRLTNEACAGALGEITKDALLYSVDTRKTRAQIKKKGKDGEEEDEAAPHESADNVALLSSSSSSSLSSSSSSSSSSSYSPNTDAWGMDNSVSLPDAALDTFLQIKELYSGFPVVLMSSIPQGGIFFIVKGGLLDLLARYAPDAPSWTTSIVPIMLGTMVYWIIRTPAEVIKTKVQATEFPDFRSAFNSIRDTEGVPSLWKFYGVMLSLDVPFQVINFILYGFISDVVSNSGIDQNILTRLGVGIGSGMIAAAVTCPLDVVKTRIQTKSKKPSLAAAAAAATVPEPGAPLADSGTRKGRTTTTASSSSSSSSSSSEEGILLQAVPDVSLDQDSLERGKREETVPEEEALNMNVVVELLDILKNEGVGTLFLGLQQRVLYTGLANGLRFAAYGTSRMDLMMRSLDDL